MPKVSLKTIKETELNKPKKHGRPQKALVVKDTTPPAIKNNKELDKNREKVVEDIIQQAEDKNVAVRVNSAPRIYCIRCGEHRKAEFYVSKDSNKKFFGRIPYCRNCIREMYSMYYNKYQSMNLGVYYTCRKIDVPYVHNCYLGALDTLDNQNSNIQSEDAIMSAYMKTLAFADRNGWGNSFDDSQGENNIKELYEYDTLTKIKRDRINNPISDVDNTSDDYEEIEYDTAFLQSKWGMTFENWELAYLEGEYLDWEEKLNGINDKTIDILVKQICYQLLDIYKDRQSGTAVDKKIKTLTDLMNNSGLIDKQDKAQEKHKTLGMEIEQIEYMKPATSGKKIFEDVDGIKNYIYGSTGCFFKAMGINNEYTDFYDKWMAPYQVPIVKDLLATKQAEQEAIDNITKQEGNGVERKDE